jgi:hypothetical protein
MRAECLPDMVVILECLRNRGEVQTLEASHLDDIVLQAPVLCLEWYYVVNVFEQAGDGVRLRAVRLGHVPEDVGSRNVVPLDGEAEAHGGRVLVAYGRAVQVSVSAGGTFGDGACGSPASCASLGARPRLHIHCFMHGYDDSGTARGWLDAFLPWSLLIFSPSLTSHL